MESADKIIRKSLALPKSLWEEVARVRFAPLYQAGPRPTDVQSEAAVLRTIIRLGLQAVAKQETSSESGKRKKANRHHP